MDDDSGPGGRMSGVEVLDCERCSALCESRTRIVNGTGPTDADLLFVGEAPGATEDERGEPFVGRSGDVLESALREGGLARGDVRITNCVRCRPPDNRDPSGEELENCRAFLDREIAAVDPALLVSLGKVPAEHLLDRAVAVTDEAGEIVEVLAGGERRRLLVSVHPAATLYDPSQRERFETAIRSAAAYATGDQSTLEEF